MQTRCFPPGSAIWSISGCGQMENPVDRIRGILDLESEGWSGDAAALPGFFYADLTGSALTILPSRRMASSISSRSTAVRGFQCPR